MMKKLVLVEILLGMFLAPAWAQGIPKDTLVVGIDIAQFVDFEPARVTGFTPLLAMEQLYNRLVNFRGRAFEPTPSLAKSWEVSADGLTWTFHLRRGVKFHSGNEVNADAVVFSLTRSLSLDFPPVWALKQYVPEPGNIKKIDDYTVAITTVIPLSEYLMESIMGILGVCAVVDPSVIEAHKTADDPWAHNWLKFHDAGSGPYKLVEWVPNDRIVFERFDDYWEGPAKTKKLIFLNIEERAQQALALKNGVIDLAWDLLPSAINEFKKLPGFKVCSIPAWKVFYVGMNVSKKPLGNPLVRKAIKYAIDYDAIVNGILEGAAVAGQTVVPVGMPGHVDATPYHKDIQKAKALLAQAGYPNGFETEIACEPFSPRREIATQIQQDLSAVGIKVKIVQLSSAQLFSLYRGQKLTMIPCEWGAGYPDPEAFVVPFAHCCSTGPDAPVRQLAWRNMYSNCELTALVDKARSTVDEEKRLEMYKQIQLELLEDGPYAVLYYPVYQYAMRENVKGFVPMHVAYYVEFWSVYKE